MTLQSRILFCPQCRRILYGYFPAFGPGKVICCRCKTELETNFPSWSATSLSERIQSIAREVIWPSFLNIKLDARSIVPWFLIMFFLIAGLPGLFLAFLYGIFEQFDPSYAVPYAVPLFFLGMMWYPIARTISILKMIRDSIAYTKSGLPLIKKPGLKLRG